MAVYIQVLKPPPQLATDRLYGHFDEPIALKQLPAYLPRGSLVAVRPLPGATWTELEATIEHAARRAVNASSVLWPDCVGPRRAITYAAKVGRLGVRGSIWRSDPEAEALRQQLTDPEGWPEAVVAWVRRRGWAVSPRAGGFLHELARHAPLSGSITEVARQCGRHEHQWRRTFAAEGLGRLGAWFAALRSVAIGLELQRDPIASVESVAFRRGYSGASALSDRLNDVIGARPTFIRHHLAWEWMLTDAFRRLQIM